MKIFWDIEHTTTGTGTILTLGTFDGIHRGHLQIIQRVVNRARETGHESALLTFEPHPQLVLRKEDHAPVRLLTTIDEKIEALNTTRLDRLIVASFTHAFATMEPEQFVRSVLLERLNMKHIIIGHDHGFGRGRRGNQTVLETMSQEYGFDISVVDPITLSDTVISSTEIRTKLNAGVVEQANRLLGRPYTLQGQVVQGDGRGKNLGFPTANIRPYNQYKLIPRPGIYTSRLSVGERVYDAVTYIGYRPTFQLSQKVVEVHVLDFDGQLYGQDVNISFLNFVRGDRQFDSSESLIAQIKQDIQDSRTLLKTKHPGGFE
jgi:riboflavin kinase/FMN adenylyltransferase